MCKNLVKIFHKVPGQKCKAKVLNKRALKLKQERKMMKKYIQVRNKYPFRILFIQSSRSLKDVSFLKFKCWIGIKNLKLCLMQSSHSYHSAVYCSGHTNCLVHWLDSRCNTNLLLYFLRFIEITWAKFLLLTT